MHTSPTQYVPAPAAVVVQRNTEKVNKHLLKTGRLFEKQVDKVAGGKERLGTMRADITSMTHSDKDKDKYRYPPTRGPLGSPLP